jgi:hypothetical protein
MTFQFVVETGDADPDANSYTSVEFADDYISTNAFVSAQWAALEEDEKEKYLVRASKYLDRMVKWAGTRVDEESGLRWPRSGAYDADGFEIPDDQIPQILQEAVCELASLLAAGTDWTAPQDGRGLTEIQVDVIDLKYDSGQAARATLPDYILQMLSDLGTVSSGRKPAFKKIIRS